MSRVDGDVLAACDKEPIHIPGAIQPHGVLCSLQDGSGVILQVSDNSGALLGSAPDELLGHSILDVVHGSSRALLEGILSTGDMDEHTPLSLMVGTVRFDGVLHQHDGALILELELADRQNQAGPPALQRALQRALSRIQSAVELPAVFDIVVEEVRRVTGFERVMLYRFDMDDHGQVVAEVRPSMAHPYLGLHFPASDIPRQARRLYRLNPLRIIPDASYEPVQLCPSLRPDTQEPLDLSFSVLRSVSPVHVEYLQNMGVRASMSLSLLDGERLWGLIACHHSTPRYVPFDTRSVCEVISRAASLQISVLQSRENRRLWAQRKPHLMTLLEQMRGDSGEVLQRLTQTPEHLLALVDAQGVAVCVGEEVAICGKAPPADEIGPIRQAIAPHFRDGLFCTNSLPRDFPEFSHLRELASGLIAMRMPRDEAHEILWFRPEVIRTVHWAGDPSKPVSADSEGRLRPRRSFDLWKEEVACTARAFLAVDRDLAADLRRYATEYDLNHQVARSLRAVRARDDVLAVVSHDLRNPLSVVAMQATLLQRRPTASLEDAASKGAINRIAKAVERMSRLTDDLLDVARIEDGRMALSLMPVDLQVIVAEAIQDMAPLAESKSISLKCSVVPALRVLADRNRLMQVLANLLSNAIRHTPEGGGVELTARPSESEAKICVADTGPGIAPGHHEKLFDRYWQGDNSQGATGLGLYICQGIVKAHGGRIWAQSEPGRGAQFIFTVPLG